MSHIFFNSCKFMWDSSTISCPNTSQQNEIFERKYHHIVETELIMMLYAHLPLRLWVNVFLTFVYLINWLPSSLINIKILYCSPIWKKSILTYT